MLRVNKYVMNIDIKSIACFGFSSPKANSWLKRTENIPSNGWNQIDDETFEENLNANTVQSYKNIATIKFKDIDTDFEYIAMFLNDQKQWKLELPGSSDEALDKADVKEFFASEEFKKICTRADQIFSAALKAALELIMPEVKKGRFINLDEIKFEAILSMLDDPQFRKNFKRGKYFIG